MVEDFNQGIKEYQSKWRQLVVGRKDKAFFDKLKPTAACWKVETVEELDRRIAELRERAEHVHYARLNGRWVATAFLREPLEWGIRIAKVYQLRPKSNDPTGFDHIDFYAAEIDEDTLADEPSLKWTHESNGICNWISLWFVGTEAKLRDNTTLDIEAIELQQASKEVIG